MLERPDAASSPLLWLLIMDEWMMMVNDDDVRSKQHENGHRRANGGRRATCDDLHLFAVDAAGPTPVRRRGVRSA